MTTTKQKIEELKAQVRELNEEIKDFEEKEIHEAYLEEISESGDDYCEDEFKEFRREFIKSGRSLFDMKRYSGDLIEDDMDLRAMDNIFQDYFPPEE